MIDTGIWPEHPSFADDGTYPRCPTARRRRRPSCDFGNTAHNPNDAAVHLQQQADRRPPDARHVSRADRRRSRRVRLGPRRRRPRHAHRIDRRRQRRRRRRRSSVVDVRRRSPASHRGPRSSPTRALGNLGGFTSDLAAAIDQAVADGVDVINYSIGGGAEPHRRRRDRLPVRRRRRRRWSPPRPATAGPAPRTIGGPADVPWLTTVGANTQSRFFEGTVELGQTAHWGGAGKGRLAPPRQTVTGASVTRARGAAARRCRVRRQRAVPPGTLDPAKVDGQDRAVPRGGNGRADKSLAVFKAGGAGMILYNASDDDNLFTDNHWVPTVHIDFTRRPEGQGLHRQNATSRRRRSRNTARSTDDRLRAVDDDLLVARPEPERRDIIKPDITAPGLQILAGNSPFGDCRRSVPPRRAVPGDRRHVDVEPARGRLSTRCSSRPTPTGPRRWRSRRS